MKRVLLGLAALALLGATWSRNIEPELIPGQTAIYGFAAADGTGFSSVKRHQCGTIGASFEDGAGGTATVQSCSDVACATSFDEQAFAADGDAVYVPRYPWLRINRTATGAGTSQVYLACGSNVAVTTAGGAVNMSDIVDDLGCVAGQSIRRDGGDVAWECYTPSSGGDNVSIDGVATTDPDFRAEGDADPIRCTGVGAPDARCVAAEDVIYEVVQADALEADAANCGANEWAAGVSTTGAAQGCTPDDDVPEAGDFGALSATSPITQAGGTISTSMSTARLLGRTTAAAGVAEQIAVASPLTLSALSLGFDPASLTLAGDVDGAANANDLDEAAVEVELEGALDIPDLQGLLPLAKLTDDAASGLCLLSGGGGGDPAYTTCPAGGGEANTHSSDGGGLVLTAATPKVGVDLRLVSVAAADFDSAANLVTIDATKWLTISAGNAAYQPLDADLTSIAALTTTTGGRSILADTLADDQVPVADDANGATWRTIPDCGESGTLNYTQASNTFSCLTDAGAGGGLTYADLVAANLAGF